MKKGQGKPSEKQTPKGVDFGSDAHALLVGSMDFVSELQASKIFGIGYGVTFSEALNTQLPQVSFLGEHPEPLIRAFNQFETWGAQSDGDVLEMTFVFLEVGGYLVGVGPEHHRLMQRVSKFDRTLSPLVIGATWTKHLETRNPAVDQFCHYKRKLVSPFVLGAATYLGEAAKDAVRPEGIRACPEVKDILKFECTFIDERDVTENSTASTILRGHQGKLPVSPEPVSAKSTAKERNPESYLKRREETFRRHFPVTRGRLLQDDRYASHFSDIAKKGVQRWQFEQAMINLMISMAISHGEKHYSSIPTNDLRRRVVDHLHSRFEFADAKDPLAGIASADIEKQILLDAHCLLKDFGIASRPRDLNSLQTLLAKQHLLD